MMCTLISTQTVTSLLVNGNQIRLDVRPLSVWPPGQSCPVITQDGPVPGLFSLHCICHHSLKQRPPSSKPGRRDSCRPGCALKPVIVLIKQRIRAQLPKRFLACSHRLNPLLPTAALLDVGPTPGACVDPLRCSRILEMLKATGFLRTGGMGGMSRVSVKP